MKENIEVLYEATVQLLSELKKLEEGNSNREQILANVQKMINQRDQLIGSIEEPYTEYDQVLGKRIILINGKIKKRMDLLYDEIETDLKNTQRRKAKNISYINPYGKMTTEEGVYVDRKK